MAKKGRLNITEQTPEFKIAKSGRKVTYTRIDLLLICVLTLAYSIFALYNLGNNFAPQTSWKNRTASAITVELENVTQVARINVFMGQTVNDYKVEISSDGTTFTDAGSFGCPSVFKWQTYDINGGAKFAKYIRLTGNKNNINNAELNEIVVFDTNKKQANIIGAIDGYGQAQSAVFDEPKTAVYDSNHLTGSYFDEIYHARSGYEHSKAMEPTETSHPPLGKLILALFINLFGMTPFIWRLPGTIMGILMIPAMYMLGKQVFKKSLFGFIPAFLMAVDFMHMTQTRIATIDSYAVLFIILMYLFMYKFYEMNMFEKSVKELVTPLMWSGIFLGLGAASKWICLYAAFGLAILFVINIIRRYFEYREACLPKYKGDKVAKIVRETFTLKLMQIAFCCIVFFGIVPALIYFCAYIPFMFITSHNYTVQEIIKYQKSMFDYHSLLTQGHPYGSKWYEWIVIKRPMWYSIDTLPNGQVMSISSFGNPAVWWVGGISVIVSVFVGIMKKSYKPLFFIVGYLSQLVPWMFVTRVVFIYHYFASVPFIIMLTTYLMWEIKRKIKFKDSLKTYYVFVGIYLGVALLLFIRFLPVIGGFATSKEYLHGLQWFSTWGFGG